MRSGWCWGRPVCRPPAGPTSAPVSGWWWACWGFCPPCRWAVRCWVPWWGHCWGATLGELVTAASALGPLGLERLRRALLVGLAVVAGMLVSRVAQFLLALLGVAGFVLLSTVLAP